MTRTAARIIGLCLGAALVFVVDSHSGNIDSVRTTVASWRRDWQARDLKRYMAHYHPRFHGNGLNRRQWRTQKAALFNRSGPLAITIADLWVVMEKNRAVARFLQHYHSQNWTETGEKTLVLIKAQTRWRIIEEKFQPLPDGKSSDSVHAPCPDSPPANKESAPSPETVDYNDGPLRLALSAGSEKVFVKLDRFFIPIVSTVNGNNPRIIIDIQGVTHWPGPANQAVAGTWIRRIRSHLHRETPLRLRIVLDLNNTDALTLNQTYIDAENSYCLELRKTERTPLIHDP